MCYARLWTVGLHGVATGFTHQLSGGFDSHTVYMANLYESEETTIQQFKTRETVTVDTEYDTEGRVTRHTIVTETEYAQPQADPLTYKIAKAGQIVSSEDVQPYILNTAKNGLHTL